VGADIHQRPNREMGQGSASAAREPIANMDALRNSTVAIITNMLLCGGSPVEVAPIFSQVYVTAYCTTDLR
jgi:hypothetical protein